MATAETSRFGRPRDPEVTTRALQAAAEVLADVGWAGFSVEAVAKHARIGKASLYRRWSSREELAAEAATHLIGSVSDVDTGTLRGDLIALGKQVAAVYAGDAGLAALRTVLDAEHIPGLEKPLGKLGSSQVKAARAILRRGAERGELPPAASPIMLLDALVGGIIAHCMVTPRRRLPDFKQRADEYVVGMVDFLLRDTKPRS